MIALDKALEALIGAGVEFIIVGGVAARARGSTRLTDVFDIVYRRNPNNLYRLVDALSPHAPYLRGCPPGLPFHFDVETLEAGLNFTLDTSLGWIDLLGEVAGGGTYESLLPHTTDVEAFGFRARCVDIDKLIDLKRAAGRPKDLEAIAELELIREILEDGGH